MDSIFIYPHLIGFDNNQDGKPTIASGYNLFDYPLYYSLIPE